MNHDEVTPLMGAYLDGELDITTCAAIEEHVASCPACQEQMEAEQQWMEAVREQTPRFEAPAFLETRIRAAIREKSGSAEGRAFWKSISLPWVVAGGAFVLLIMAGGVDFSRPARMPALVKEAVADHVRSLQVSHLMDIASTDQHTVKPWFAGKIDFSPQVIDLSGSGYPLIGGRLDVMDGRNVAALIYQRRKHYINLFVWPAGTNAVPAYSHTENGYHVLAWAKAGMNYVAVSDLGEAEFKDFAGMIQQQTVETRAGE